MDEEEKGREEGGRQWWRVLGESEHKEEKEREEEVRQKFSQRKTREGVLIGENGASCALSCWQL